MEKPTGSPSKRLGSTVSQGGKYHRSLPADPIMPKPKDHVEEDSEEDDNEDLRMKWLGQDQLSGRPNDWVSGYTPAFSTAYRERLEAERAKKPKVKIEGYSGNGSVRNKFKTFPFN